MKKVVKPLVVLSAAQVRKLRTELLLWFGGNRRELPWREQATPYGVWVSEVMLQQTRVDVVRGYFERWMEAFPTLESLAESEEGEVLKLWQGLGYYSRARRLRLGAQFVCEAWGGRLPSAPQKLKLVPGIGPYSAGAISSIAFGEPSAIVDGNVIRVLTRLFALSGDPHRAQLKAELWRVAGQLVPKGSASEFNQGLMELGALVCTPKKPRCTACPWQSACVADARGEVERYPELPARPQPTPLRMVTVILTAEDKFVVHVIPPDARWWAGLDAFPFANVADTEAVTEAAMTLVRGIYNPGAPCGELLALPVVRHTVTRYRVTLYAFVLNCSLDAIQRNGYRAVSFDQLEILAFPAPHRKIVGLLRKSVASPRLNL